MTHALDLLLPPTPLAPAAAREAIDGLALLQATPQTAFDVRLLVSELVTNSVRHAGLTDTQAVRLVVEISPHKVRCAIHDPGPGFTPQEPLAPGTRDAGWGLHLVNRLTDRWGIEKDPDTHVWFEINLTHD